MDFISNRDFQVWDYNVSHKQLLVRSARSSGHSTNIDIVFWQVAYIEIVALFNGVHLSVASTDNMAGLASTLKSKFDSHGCYELVSGGISNFVLASGCRVLENVLDIFDSSLVYFNRDRSVDEYGTILWPSDKQPHN